MANQKEILPKAEYEVANVGPARNWEFNGDSGAVEMATDQVQFKDHEQYWVDVNRQRKAEPPKVGDKLTGNITQDEDGKYNPKFNKEKGAGRGGFGGGNRGSSPGAVWSSAVETAANICAAYATISGKKPKSIDEFLKRIEQVAPKVNDMVDRLVGKAKPAETKPADTAASESGESAAPAAAADKPASAVEVDDIKDDELEGDW